MLAGRPHRSTDRQPVIKRAGEESAEELTGVRYIEHPSRRPLEEEPDDEPVVILRTVISTRPPS